MHHMAMLRLGSLNALAHALECHKDHLEDARSEFSDSARAALNGTDFNKFDQVSKEITSISSQLKLVEAVKDEIRKSKQIGANVNRQYQFQFWTEQADALFLIMENYCEMQYDILRGELRSVTRGELTINPANIVLNVLDEDEGQLERTVEAAFLEGYFKALR